MAEDANREIEKSYYAFKRRMKIYPKFKKGDVEPPLTQYYSSNVNRILKETGGKGITKENLKRVDDMGKNYIRLLEKANRLKGEETFDIQSPKRQKAIGYNYIEKNDTWTWYARTIYNSLLEAGYDKKIIAERINALKEAEKKAYDKTIDYCSKEKSKFKINQALRYSSSISESQRYTNDLLNKTEAAIASDELIAAEKYEKKGGKRARKKVAVSV
jgi:hypothetical protein